MSWKLFWMEQVSRRPRGNVWVGGPGNSGKRIQIRWRMGVSSLCHNLKFDDIKIFSHKCYFMAHSFISPAQFHGHSHSLTAPGLSPCHPPEDQGLSLTLVISVSMWISYSKCPSFSLLNSLTTNIYSVLSLFPVLYQTVSLQWLKVQGVRDHGTNCRDGQYVTSP